MGKKASGESLLCSGKVLGSSRGEWGGSSVLDWLKKEEGVRSSVECSRGLGARGTRVHLVGERRDAAQQRVGRVPGARTRLKVAGARWREGISSGRRWSALRTEGRPALACRWRAARWDYAPPCQPGTRAPEG